MKRIIVALLILGVLFAGGYAGVQYMKSRPVEIKSAAAKKGTIVEYVSASGQIEPNSLIKVSSPANGKVKEVYVKQGEWVDEDDKIVKIEDYGKVKSPMDGTIVEIDPAEGDYTYRGKTLATIADLSPVYLVVKVDESDISKIKASQRANVAFDSYPDAKVVGSVLSIGMISTRTEGGGTAFPVKVKIVSNRGAKIRLGMSADIEIAVARKVDVVKTPIESVDSRDGKDVVFIITGDKVQMKTVAIGLSTDSDYEVTSGIKAGEKVAISKLDLLKNGSRVDEK